MTKKPAPRTITRNCHTPFVTLSVMTVVALPTALNPAQQEVLDVLGAPRETWPRFDPELRTHLRNELETNLEPLAHALERVGATPLYISKHLLSSVHGCEQRFIADRDAGFPGWSAPRARGAVAHKAIELSVHVRDERVPGPLVDEALARLAAKDNGLATWLQEITEFDRADLKSHAVAAVAAFLDCWPRLKPAWRPVLEGAVRTELAGDRITLRGKPDMTLGSPIGSQAGKVIIDLKTGAFSPDHLHDLRFYALVETLRLGVPPRRVATYYLDAGRFVPADVTVNDLLVAARRVVDAVGILVELLAGGRPPELRAGPACRWCSLLDECSVGQGSLVVD